MKQHLFSKWSFVILTFAFVLVGFAQQGSLQFPTASPMDFTTGRVRIHVVPIVTGLAHPWSLAFLPDGRLLVAEQTGRLRIIRNGMLDPQPVWTAPGFTRPHRQTFFMASMFILNMRRIISCTSRTRNPALVDSHSRSHGENWKAPSSQMLQTSSLPMHGILLQVSLLPDASCSGPTAPFMWPLAIRDLLFGTNDNSSRMRAQALDTHIGKVLRIRDDGGVPNDNPFVGKAGVKPEIFTYGNRNTYGFAFHPMTGELWQAEIGPMGGDEVNILSPWKKLRMAAGLDGP